MFVSSTWPGTKETINNNNVALWLKGRRCGSINHYYNASGTAEKNSETCIVCSLILGSERVRANGNQKGS